MIDRLGGRKATALFLLGTAGIVLDSTMGLSPAVVELLTYLMGFFVTGNVFEHGFGALLKVKGGKGGGVNAVAMRELNEEVRKSVTASISSLKDDMKSATDLMVTKLDGIEMPESNGALPDGLETKLQVIVNNSAMQNDSMALSLKKIDHMSKAAGFGTIN